MKFEITEEQLQSIEQGLPLCALEVITTEVRKHEIKEHPPFVSGIKLDYTRGRGICDVPSEVTRMGERAIGMWEALYEMRRWANSLVPKQVYETHPAYEEVLHRIRLLQGRILREDPLYNRNDRSEEEPEGLEALFG